jgi:YD repeat-containing protein
LHGAKVAKQKNLKDFFMKKIKKMQVFYIDVAPEGEFADFRSKPRTAHQLQVFDEQENLLEEVKFDHFGNEIGKSVFAYNENGHLIAEETYDEFGNLEEKQTFKRDDKGKLLQSFVHYLDESVDAVDYAYNDNGRLIRKTLTNDDGEVESEDKVEYDGDLMIKEVSVEQGEVVKEHEFFYGDSDKPTEASIRNQDEAYRLVNDYDENGNLVKTLKYDTDDNLIEKHVMRYDNENRLIEKTEEDQMKKNTISIDYDDKGHAVGQKEANSGGSLNHQVERDYNEDGRLEEIRAVLYGPGQVPERKYLLVYEYEYF